ncbi:hypothetical protein A2U01_0075670, partial [Trifolium medium]|nr:hypothetical protein [Trifolium medium]
MTQRRAQLRRRASSTVLIGVEHDSTSSMTQRRAQSTLHTDVEHGQIACWSKATCLCSTVT